MSLCYAFFFPFSSTSLCRVSLGEKVQEKKINGRKSRKEETFNISFFSILIHSKYKSN